MIPQHAEMVDRLLDAYNAAELDTRDAGRRWYGDAAELARELGPRGAEVIAALSPRMVWTDNVKAARCVALADCEGPIRAIGGNVLKARRIVDGARIEDVTTDRARKVRAFARAIAGDDSAVVVDSHAARAAGAPLPATPRQYGAIEDAYRDAAELAGERPRDFQAIVWIQQRGAAA